MTILVTGGAGFIGSHTCVELLNAGYEVIILDNFYNSNSEVLKRIKEITGKPFSFYECDIRDSEGLEDIFEENEIDAVIHFAGLKAVGESCQKPLEYYDNNIYGTLVLCEAMGKAGCKKIVFSSSATVYGSDNISPLREDMKVGGTTNPYGTTKLYIENILNDLWRSDNEWSISLLRYLTR
jgi:UDP-glucose 4-epimerase